MTTKSKDAVKNLVVLERLCLQIKFKGKESLHALKNILMETKEFGNNLEKENPEMKSNNFKIEKLISDLNSDINKDRISQKKLKWTFLHTVDILKSHVLSSFRTQLTISGKET